jgi:hypothetical protein
MGNSCIEAAKTVVDFLPDEPNARLIYDQGPWWCIVHHLMQAVSVLLLALSYPASTSHDSMLLMHYVRKSIRRLQVMEDPVAKRACQVAMNTFETVWRWYPVDVAGMWKKDSVHGNEVPAQHPVNPDITVYLPRQEYMPQDTVTASGYTSYDAASTAASIPAYHGTAVFKDNYHMSR